MKLTAFHNYVIVRPDRDNEDYERESGIVLPEAIRPVPVTGVVESLGPDARVEGLEVGAKVLYPPHGVGEEVTVERETFVIMLDHEVLGVFHA